MIIFFLTAIIYLYKEVGKSTRGTQTTPVEKVQKVLCPTQTKPKLPS
jgi:hypothetical protein